MHANRVLPYALLLAAIVFAGPAFGQPAPLRDVRQIALGTGHTCALSQAGRVQCWGRNDRGQLGVGDASPVPRPVPVAVLGLGDDVRAIASGLAHSCALTASGTVLCWGWNAYGQLGDGTTIDRLAATAVAGLSGRAIAIDLGSGHSCALLEGGTVQCWGINEDGQLGDGTTTMRTSPVTVQNVAGASAVSAGGQHTCAAIANGGARCWGSNALGQLGDGTTTSRPVAADVSALPAVMRITAGSRHTCAIITSGGVRCWGDNGLFQIGDGTPETRLVPVEVSGFSSRAVAISAATFHTCALTTEGTVRCWGDNFHGSLGNGEIDTAFVPVDVAGIATANGIDTGGSHSCATLADGTARCWGLNFDGQLGIDSTTQRLVPTAVAGLGSGTASVSAGSFHRCALTAAGGVKCWGGNAYGQLGDDTQRLRLTPVDVVGLTAGARFVTTGFDHSCAITAAGGAQCWGANFDGQLGNGGDLGSAVPVDVTGLTSGVQALAAGREHSCALLTSGALRCWGSNRFGEVGDGTTERRATAVDVSGLSSGVAAVTAGIYHTCALTTAGGVKCWGLNDTGQLGDGSTTTRLAPVDVQGLTSGVRAIAAGYGHTCAVTTGGAVLCWGASFFGDLLGDGSTVDRPVPGPVPALTRGVVAIALAGYNSCVLLDTGAVQCWGSNYLGQVGDNSTIDRPEPVEVAGLTAGARAIGQSCAVIGNGALQCWGDNNTAQLGDGTFYGVPLPQTVVVDPADRQVSAVAAVANDISIDAQSDASGRYVVVQSRASNLVPGDTNGSADVFVIDRQDGTTRRVSVANDGGQLTGDAIEPAISTDGTLIAFVAADAAVANVAGEGTKSRTARRKGGAHAVFMRNLLTGTTQRVGTAVTGGTGTRPQLAANGVAIVYTATNADPQRGAVGQDNVHVVPLAAVGNARTIGEVRCVSCKAIAADGSDGSAAANGASRDPVVSADGRMVAYQTAAKNTLAAVPSPCASGTDVVMRDLLSGAAQRVSPPATLPSTACGTVGSGHPSIDHAGTVVAFDTDQALKPTDRNSDLDAYVWTVANGTTVRVSEGPDGVDGTGASGAPVVSGDGRQVAFVSTAPNLDVAFGDNNDRADVHAARADGTGDVQRLSRSTSGGEANGASDRPSLNYDGTQVAFDSRAANLVRDAITGQGSVYQRVNPIAPAKRSATWWISAEGGWGLSVFDQGNLLVPAWFTYDLDGEPAWFLVAGAFLQADGSYRGSLFRLTGVPFDRIDGPATETSTPIGTATLRYRGEDELEFEYDAAGVVQRKTMSRFPYGPRTFGCVATPASTRAVATNYTDVWTGAGDNPGWGLTLFHIDDAVFAAWYTYDADREPVFFIVSTSRQPDGSYAGQVLRQRNGTPFPQISAAPPSPGNDVVGTATLRFTDGTHGTFGYSIGSVTQNKPIVRLQVGDQATVCTTQNVTR